MQIDNIKQCHFQFFWVILDDIDPKRFFKKSKTSCTVFIWDALQQIMGKKI